MYGNRAYSLRMDAFEAYKVYIALKSHFTTKYYDYFKYNGRTRASRSTFEKRADKYYFHKLSKRKDIVDFLVSNFVYNGDDWVGNLVQNNESEKCYRTLLRTRESLSYIFSEDLDKLKEDFDSNFTVEDGQHPYLLKLYLRKDICIETLIILDDLVGCFKKWNKKIDENVLWPQLYLKCRKYKQFFEYDRSKLKQVVLNKFSN